MAMTRSAACQSSLTVTRTSNGGGIGPDNTTTVSAYNTNETLNAGSTPACSLDAELSLALNSGAVTLDLTAVVDPDLGTVNFNGLTVQHLKLKNPSTNANTITVAKGASNGYTGFGASFQVQIQPGGEALLMHAGAAVNSTVKTLDLTGTGAQALQIQITGG